MDCEKQLLKLIKSVSFPFKTDKELKLALKAKLTKRELKLLTALCRGLSKEEINLQLRLDNSAYTLLYNKLVKKLNQEKVKQAICDYSAKSE